MQLADRQEFFPEAGRGVKVSGVSYYTRAAGVEKLRRRSTQTESDKSDTMERSFSSDNGRTWTEPEQVRFIFKQPDGVFRRSARPEFVDPVTDRMVGLVCNGLFPTDSPLEGLKSRYFTYRVSTDGGKTWDLEEQVIQTGAYDEDHPLEGVWLGRNGVNVGDMTCRPIRSREGKLLFPIQIAPLGPNGEYYNPGGGHTYGEAAVLIGTWTGNDRVDWDLSHRVKIPPERSTRGAIEPTIAEMPDGRILMILRGSNDVRPEIPGYRWEAVSSDGGRTWTSPEPWTFTDGTPFFSPSSCSQLLRHSDGRYYWLGNICSRNPRGNRPRYPLVVGQVDPKSLCLMQETLLTVDDRGPNDHEKLTLSNFMAHEDRETGEILVHMSRAWQHGDRTSAAYLYRVEP